LEEELERVKRQTYSLSDSGGFSSKLDVLEYKIYVLDEQRDLLIAHKDILMGVPGTPNEVVFAELDKHLEDLRLAEVNKCF